MAGCKSTLSGEDFYGAYDAQEFATATAPELGMQTVPSLNITYTEVGAGCECQTVWGGGAGRGGPQAGMPMVPSLHVTCTRVGAGPAGAVVLGAWRVSGAMFCCKSRSVQWAPFLRRPPTDPPTHPHASPSSIPHPLLLPPWPCDHLCAGEGLRHR